MSRVRDHVLRDTLASRERTPRDALTNCQTDSRGLTLSGLIVFFNMPSSPISARGSRGGQPLPPWFPKGMTRVLLLVYVGLCLVSGLLSGWVGPWGKVVIAALVCETSTVLHGQVWRPFTAVLVQAPSTMILLFGLLTIVFFAPDLRARWGVKKFAAVLVLAPALGYLVNVGVDAAFSLLGEGYLSSTPLRPQSVVFDATPAMTALIAGWALENRNATVRAMMFIPMQGIHLYFLGIAMCTLHVFFGEHWMSGNLAVFVGIGVATLASGQPAMLRRLWLRTRLAGLSRDRAALEALERAGAPGKKKRAPGGPDLRVLPGGAEDPKDKRYLN